MLSRMEVWCSDNEKVGSTGSRSSLRSGAEKVYKFIDFRLITQAVIFLLAVISVSYPFGLRKIPFFKIVIISFVWSITTMLLLVVENDVVIKESKKNTAFVHHRM